MSLSSNRYMELMIVLARHSFLGTTPGPDKLDEIRAEMDSLWSKLSVYDKFYSNGFTAAVMMFHDIKDKG